MQGTTGSRAETADKQRHHPKYHEVLASNRLTAANIFHRQKQVIAGCIFDLFIAGRCLLIDIEPLLKDRQNKEKLARLIGLTYRAISKAQVSSIADLVKFMPYVSEYRERNARAFDRASQLITAIKDRRANG